MATYNPNISNGTCYYTVNKETKGNFIPCGNNALQVWPCCQLGSICLSLGDANACYDAKSGNAYVAGCTDPSFVSPNCLYKKEKFKDQEWVGISQACKNLNTNSGPDNTKWTGCIVDERSTELVKLPLSNCTGSCVEDDVIYVGPTSLAAYASLPTIAGSSIFWQSNFVPPVTPAAGYTPGTTTPVVGTSKPGPSSGASASSGSSSGLSTGAKAGIGVGAAVGGILLIAIIASLIMRMRRREKQKYASPSDPNNHNNHNNHNNNNNPPPPATASGYPSSAGFHQSQYSQDMTMYPPSSIGHPSPPLPYNATFYHQNMATPTGYTDSPHQHTHHQGGPNMGFKSELPAEDVAPSYKPPLSPATTVMGAASPPPGSTRGEAPKYSEGRGW